MSKALSHTGHQRSLPISPRTLDLWSVSSAELTLLQLFLSFSCERVHPRAPPLPPALRHLQQQVPLLLLLLPRLWLSFADPGSEPLVGLPGNTHCYSGKRGSPISSLCSWQLDARPRFRVRHGGVISGTLAMPPHLVFFYSAPLKYPI